MKVNSTRLTRWLNSKIGITAVETYSTAAYSSALLGEISAYDGRKADYRQFYQDLLNRYPRHRGSLRELATRVDGA